ncbi:MAG: hypothetical protein ABIB71_01200, partial [Candidatus Woesearchaeota archaeon]
MEYHSPKSLYSYHLVDISDYLKVSDSAPENASGYGIIEANKGRAAKKEAKLSTEVAAAAQTAKKEHENVSDYKLINVQEAYGLMKEGRKVSFLDENLNKIEVEGINASGYDGRIYDVTVPNHVILVKRDGLVTWSGNSLERNFTNLAAGKYEFKAYVVDMAGNLNETGWYEVHVNHMPKVEGSVSISPTVATANDDLNCSFNITDNDTTDKLYANVSWYNNTVLYKTYEIVVSSGVQNSHVLKAANTSSGETWNCSVRGYDEKDYSAPTSTTRAVGAAVAVTLDTPLDFWVTNSTVTFECNASSSVYVDNISLYHNASGNWLKNETIALTGQTTPSVMFNITSIAEGNLSWNCYACDNHSY